MKTTASLPLSALAMALTLALSGCMSTGTNQAPIENAKPVEPAPAPAPAPEDSYSEEDFKGDLISDATITMETNPQAVKAGVNLADKLEQDQGSPETQLGAAQSYDGIKEDSAVAVTNTDFNLVPSQPNQLGQSNQPVAGIQESPVRVQESTVTPPPPAGGVYHGPNAVNSTELNGYQMPQEQGACSLALNAQASGIARTVTKELAGRLRSEQGTIYVAPTIIDREYEDCIKDLSFAVTDGLRGSQTFQLVPATTNLNNIISQNIGSATIIPSLIHQCRAANISYLVITQVSKRGDSPSLNLRLIRTNDGITLGQSYRRLGQ